MLAFVAIIALFNLMLGMGVAIVVSHDMATLKRGFYSLPIPFMKRTVVDEHHHEQAHGEQGHAETHAAGVDAHHAEKPAKPAGLDIPAAWAELLQAEGIHPRTPFEAVVLCLRMQLNAYQPALTKFEWAIREMSAAPVREILAKQLEELKQAVEPWKAWTTETVAWMSTRHETLGTDETTSTDLEEALLDRVTHAKNVLRLAGSCAEEGKTEAVLRALQHEINRDLEGTHTLVDRTLDLLAEAFAGEERAHELPLTWQKDTVTKLHNRCGLESLATEWRMNDPQQKRLLSGLFVECDRMGKLNERFGTARGDQIFASFSRLVYDAIRNDRGDRAARISGSTIAVLLADTGAAGARCAAERIRQSIEASTFQVGAEEITLIANCAVTEFMLDDQLPDVLNRLAEGIKEAKKAGRNRTAIDEGDGPKVFEALPMTVKGRVIQVAEAGAAENSTAEKPENPPQS